MTKLLKGKKVMHNKWVYQLKNKHDGSKCYKARLVDKEMLTKGVAHDKLGLCTTLVGLLSWRQRFELQRWVIGDEIWDFILVVEQSPGRRLLGYGVCF